MSLNKHDRAKVEKEAKENGYQWNADKTKMINNNGGQLKFSETGQSAKLKTTTYNDVNGIKKSKNW